MTARRICVLTGTRADYGHLYWVMREIDARPGLHLLVVVTGAHLDPRFGGTVSVVEADGFNIHARVPLPLDDDSGVAVAAGMGVALAGIARALDELRPDLLVLLGDRYEELVAAEAALVLGIPVAHLHGGETTEGAFDESIRHAVTKMSHLHFVAAEPYARRVVQMGEDPARVFDVGAPGLDHVARTALAEREELERHLSIELTSPVIVVTHHPETLAPDGGLAGLRALLAVLARRADARIVVTGVNADPGHDSFARLLDDFVAADPARRVYATSLGQSRYLGLLRLADVVVGNSSSGLIEAPAMATPTVNVGDRQRGRLRAASVIDVAAEESAIAAAIDRALDPNFRTGWPTVLSRYGVGDAAIRIADVLERVDLDGILVKRFVDAGRS